MNKKITPILVAVVVFANLIFGFAQANAMISQMNPYFETDGFTDSYDNAGAGGDTEAFDMVIDYYGRSIVVGYSNDGVDGYQPTIWRYQINGEMDPEFGDGSCLNGATSDPTMGCMVIRGSMGGAEGAMYGVDLLEDGSIIAVGWAINEFNNQALTIWKIIEDPNTGEEVLDPTFGDGTCVAGAVGAVTMGCMGGTYYMTELPLGIYAVAYDVKVDMYDNVYVSGYADDDFSNMNSLIIKIDADGNYDTSFSEDGYLTFDYGAESGVGSFERVSTLEIINRYSEDYQIAFVSNYKSGLMSSPIVSTIGLLSQAGEYVTGFGTDGTYLEDFSVLDMVFDEYNSRLVLLGYDTVVVTNYGDITVLDMDEESLSYGLADTSFSEDGEYIDDTYSQFFSGVVFDDGGMIVANDDGDGLLMNIFKFNSDGTLDDTFGTNGIYSEDISSYSTWVDAYEMQSYGNDIYIVGYVMDSEGVDYGLGLWDFNLEYQISDLGASLLAYDIYGNSIETGSSYGILGVGPAMIFNSDDEPLAFLILDFFYEVDGSSLSGANDWDNYKMFLDGEDGMPVTYPVHVIYVPRGENHNSVYVCPDATSLEEVYIDCPNGYRLQDGDEMMTSFEEGGKLYWAVAEVYGTGAISYYYSELVDTNGAGASHFLVAGALFSGLTVTGSYIFKKKKQA